MTREIKEAVGRPDNSAFVRRCVIFGIILAAMLSAPQAIFPNIMLPMAADGLTVAWYAIFVPLALVIMAIGLFRSWRRRWPLAYMKEYNSLAREYGYDYCPRCGAQFILKSRTKHRREKVGEEITTTTYGDGRRTVDRKDVYGSVSYTSHYYQCTNSECGIEADKHYFQCHLPWKKKQIECLVLNDHHLLDRKHSSASQLLLSRLLIPILAVLVILVAGYTVYRYADSHVGDWTFAAADKKASRTAEEYQEYLMSLDTLHKNWSVSYENEPSDMMSYLGESFLGKEYAKGYSIESCTTENGTVLYFRFEGDDAGTGISDGWYCIMQIDGVDVLIDEDNEIIYKQGTEFYDTYAPKLIQLTHDSVLSAIFASVEGGEHAMSDMNMEYIKKGNSTVLSYMLTNDTSKISGGEFRAATLHPEEQSIERWYFSYNDNEFTPDDISDYVYSDAAN